jgi:hypothetical protein
MDKDSQDPIGAMTGVILKHVYFLNPKLSKFVITGFFMSRNMEFGYLIKDDKGYVHFPKTFLYKIDGIDKAVKKKRNVCLSFDDNCHIRIDCGSNHQYIYISDGENTVSLDEEEWDLFLKSSLNFHSDWYEIFEGKIKRYITYFSSDIDSYTFDLPVFTVSHQINKDITLWKLSSNSNHL